jgi:GNAT superfamily N-acetyltransferase
VAINEYDKMLDTGKPGTSGNEYDAMLRADAPTQRQALEQSMFVAAKAEPDRAAKVAALAKEVNLPPALVDRRFDEIQVKSQQAKTDYDGLIDSSPNLAKWLEDPTNASMAKDDIENLQKVERTVNDYGFVESLGSDLRSGMNSAAARISKIPGFLADVVIRKKTLGLFSTNDLGIENLPAQYFEGEAQKYATPNQQINILEAAGKGDYANAGKGLAAQIAANAPNTAALIAASFIGGPAAGAVVAGGGSAAEKYDENIKKGVLPQQALGNAVATGAIEVGAESLPFGTLGVLKKQATALTARYGKNVSREVLKEAFTQIGKSVMQEGTEEAITSFAQDLTDYAMDVNPDALDGILERAGNSFVVGAGSGGLTTGPSAVAAGMSRSRDIRQAQRATDFYNALGDSVEATKLRKRLPEAQRQVVEQITKGTGVQDIYVPIEAMESYFQDKKISPVAIAQELGITAAYEDAKDSGGDVKIPLATWTAKIVGTEHYKGLANDVKFNPEALTVNQANAENQRVTDELAAEEAKARQAEADAQANEERIQIEQSANEVQQQFADLLTNTGKFDAKQIEQYSTLVREHYAARAENRGLGEQPLALFQRQNLDLVTPAEFTPAPMAAAAQTQEQESYEQTAVEDLLPLDVNDDLIEITIDEGDIAGQSLGGDYERMLSAQGEESAPKLMKKYGDFKNVFSLDSVSIKDEFQGQGKASVLLDSFIAGARENGADAIVLNASPMGGSMGLKDLVSFYKSRGFKVIDKAKDNQTMLLDLRESLDQSGQASPRGRILFGNGQNIIQLFAESDASTVLHEAGHLWLEELITDATTAGVNPNLVKDLDTILTWMGLDVRAKDGREAVKKAIQTDHHEQWARGFEAYLMEGKAPSQALRKAFARFKLWLTRIYQNIRALDVELTDDVRGVFDRMLVSEQAMKDAQTELAYDPLFVDPKAMGMNETQAARYSKALEEANQSAIDRLTNRLMEDVAKKNRAKYREESAKIQEQVESEVAGDQRYLALDYLQAGELPDGTPFKLDRAAIVEEYGEAFLKNLPRPVVYTREGGISHRVAAEMLGFESGDQLLTTLANVLPKKEYIPAEVTRRMNELYPDLTDPEAIREEAKALAHTEDRAKVLRLELEHLASNNLPVLKDAIRRVTKRLPTEAMVREQAERMVSRQKVGELRPKAYQAAVTRSAREAGVALAKGDIEAAFEAKRRELLNLELFRAAEKNQADMKKALERFKKFKGKDADLAKTRDMDLVNAGRAILQRFGLGKAQKTPAEYLEAMKNYDPEMYANVSEIVNGAVQNAAPFREVSFDNFFAMADLVDSIWELSKSTREMEIEGKKVDRDEVKAELSARLQEMGAGGELPGMREALTDKEKRTKGIANVKNLLTRVEHWAYTMDRGEFAGPFSKFLVRPILEATTQYRLKRVETLKQLRDIVRELEIPDATMKIDAPEIGYKFTKPELIMALLHTGNDSNKKKLLLGRGWGSLNADGTLDTTRWDTFLSRAMSTGVGGGIITQKDWETVQKIWDLNESLKPAAQKAHKKLYGHYFNEITAKEFTTPWGSFRGGYMPAISDQNISIDANIRAGERALEDSPSQMFPTTGRGFSKNRENNFNTALSLDFSKIQNHVDKVLKFTYIEPSIKDASRLLKDRGLRQELSTHTSDVAKDLLEPWLKRAATQKSTTPGFSATVDRALSTFRRSSSVQFMVANVTNAIQNTTGLFPVMARVKTKFVAGSFKRYLTSPKAYAAEVLEASAYMRTRSGENANEILKEIDEVILQPSKFQEFKESSIRHGYVMDRMTNGMVEIVAWGAAYNEAIEAELSHDDAVRKADATVRQSLAGMNPEDSSQFETGTPLVKLFTMFSGFFNTQANLLASELTVAREEGLTTKEGALRAARAWTFVVALPAIAGGLIMRAMAGQGIDEDDDGEYFDEFFDIVFGTQFRYLFAMAPGGSIVNSVVNRFNNKPYDDKISVSPAIGNLEKALGSVVSIPKALGVKEVLPKNATPDVWKGGGSVSKALRDGLPALGLITGLPAAPLAKPLGYAADVAEGKARPTGPVDAVRGAVTGKSGSK